MRIKKTLTSKKIEGLRKAGGWPNCGNPRSPLGYDVYCDRCGQGAPKEWLAAECNDANCCGGTFRKVVDALPKSEVILLRRKSKWLEETDPGKPGQFDTYCSQCGFGKMNEQCGNSIESHNQDCDGEFLAVAITKDHELEVSKILGCTTITNTRYRKLIQYIEEVEKA